MHYERKSPAFHRDRERKTEKCCSLPSGNTRAGYSLAINGNANFMRTSREENVRIRGIPVEQEEERKSVSFRVVCPEISVAAHHVTLNAMNSI